VHDISENGDGTMIRLSPANEEFNIFDRYSTLMEYEDNYVSQYFHLYINHFSVDSRKATVEYTITNETQDVFYSVILKCAFYNSSGEFMGTSTGICFTLEADECEIPTFYFYYSGAYGYPAKMKVIELSYQKAEDGPEYTIVFN
jgi:hypothetical protein